MTLPDIERLEALAEKAHRVRMDFLMPYPEADHTFSMAKDIMRRILALAKRGLQEQASPRGEAVAWQARVAFDGWGKPLHRCGDWLHIDKHAFDNKLRHDSGEYEYRELYAASPSAGVTVSKEMVKAATIAMLESCERDPVMPNSVHMRAALEAAFAAAPGGEKAA